MIQDSRYRIYEKGLGIIEIVVAVAVLVVAATGIFLLAKFSLQAQRAVTLERRATLIAREALAVARFERDGDWDTFAGKPVDTFLYPTFSVNSASLSTINPGTVDGIFTSTVTLSTVYRDVSGNIAPTGASDAGAREVTIAVTWTSPFGNTADVTVETYLMQ